MQDMYRQEMLKKIQEVGFAGVDLNLYLDNNPNDQDALMIYNSVTEELKYLMQMYEMRYGPLLDHGYSPSSFPFQWVEEPWPWERDF